MLLKAEYKVIETRSKNTKHYRPEASLNLIIY
jgi:hypothetical protein